MVMCGSLWLVTVLDEVSVAVIYPGGHIVKCDLGVK